MENYYDSEAFQYYKSYYYNQHYSKEKKKIPEDYKKELLSKGIKDLQVKAIPDLSNPEKFQLSLPISKNELTLKDKRQQLCIKKDDFS